MVGDEGDRLVVVVVGDEGGVRADHVDDQADEGFLGLG